MKKYTKTLAFILLAPLLIWFTSSKVSYFYFNPETNTDGLPFINKTISIVERAGNFARNNINGKDDVKIIYQNAYGSGFLRNNPIPNDLDYSIGVHLGQYDYDGKNQLQIAKGIEDKISTFQIVFYEFMNNKTEGIYSDYDMLSSIAHFFKQKNTTIDAISTGIPNIFDSKQNIVKINRKFDEKSSFDDYFVLGENEILIPQSDPISLFSRKVTYNKNESKYLKEISISIDFYVDIKNKKTNEVKTVEFVAESFVGHRNQLSRKIFVPMVFVGDYSKKYLENSTALKEDYVKTRLFNYKRHLQELSNLNQEHDRPVKKMKRILQCANLIAPALDKQTLDDINSTIYENLSNENIQALNDYSTALANLIKITQMPKLFHSHPEEITLLITATRGNLDSLKKNGKINEASPLYTFQKELEKNEITSEKIVTLMDIYDPEILKIYNDSMKNQAEMQSYRAIFEKVLTDAGFHKASIYWLDNNTIGVLKDDFTKTIPEKDLRKVAVENDLVDINYKFITSPILLTTKHNVWIQHNLTPQEKENWKLLQQALLQEKANLNVYSKRI